MAVLDAAIRSGEGTVEAVQPYLPNRRRGAVQYKLRQMMRAEAPSPREAHDAAPRQQTTR